MFRSPAASGFIFAAIVCAALAAVTTARPKDVRHLERWEGDGDLQPVAGRRLQSTGDYIIKNETDYACNDRRDANATCDVTCCQAQCDADNDCAIFMFGSSGSCTNCCWIKARPTCNATSNSGVTTYLKRDAICLATPTGYVFTEHVAIVAGANDLNGGCTQLATRPTAADMANATSQCNDNTACMGFHLYNTTDGFYHICLKDSSKLEGSANDGMKLPCLGSYTKGCPATDWWCTGAGEVANITDCDGDGLLDWTCTYPTGLLGTIRSKDRTKDDKCLWMADYAPVTSCPQIFSRFLPNPGWGWGFPESGYKNNTATSSKDCFNQCKMDTSRKCFAWAFQETTNQCSLKTSGPKAASNNGFYQASGVVSGNINGEVATGVFVPNTDLTWGAEGSEYALAGTSTALECYSQCAADSGCFAWVWNSQAAADSTCLFKARNSTAPVGNNYKGFVFSSKVTSGNLDGDVLDCPEYAKFANYTYYPMKDGSGDYIGSGMMYSNYNHDQLLAAGDSGCNVTEGCKSFAITGRDDPDWQYEIGWWTSDVATRPMTLPQVTAWRQWRCSGLYVRIVAPAPPPPEPPLPLPPSPPRRQPPHRRPK